MFVPDVVLELVSPAELRPALVTTELDSDVDVIPMSDKSAAIFDHCATFQAHVLPSLIKAVHIFRLLSLTFHHISFLINDDWVIIID